MAIQFSTTVRNNMLDQIEATAGTSAVLRVYTGSAPANCAAAATGTLIASMSLPSDWMAAASSGSKAMSGTWQDASADASGTAGYFRIWDSSVTTCHVQGTCSATGGGGDLTFDNAVFASGQQINVTSFSISAGNA